MFSTGDFSGELSTKISVPGRSDNVDDESDEIQPHVFCDASVKVYGAVAYYTICGTKLVVA